MLGVRDGVGHIDAVADQAPQRHADAERDQGQEGLGPRPGLWAEGAVDGGATFYFTWLDGRFTELEKLAEKGAVDGPSLAKLMASFYLCCALFIVLVLGAIARLGGFNIFRFLRYIREELLLVLGTSSSESALVPLMQKLERLGCGRSVVGLVVPSGYSFNLDGTNIYLTMAAIFVAQAVDVDLSLTQELTLLAVAMLTSKGASGVTGAGFITLAATLQTTGRKELVLAMALILGVDRFMSEARAITNTIGNAVGTVAIARWVGSVDRQRLEQVLDGKTEPCVVVRSASGEWRNEDLEWCAPGRTLRWTDDGRRVAVNFFSYDNKDRWLATVDLATRKLVVQHRLTDPAWIVVLATIDDVHPDRPDR